nr:MAG TPA: hypothetical protein [Caudoviricetes sp.]
MWLICWTFDVLLKIEKLRIRHISYTLIGVGYMLMF